MPDQYLDQWKPDRPAFKMAGDAVRAINDYANKPDPTMPGGLANPALSKIAGFMDLDSMSKFLDKTCKITVPILPFSKIDEMGAGMYKGEKISLSERKG